MLAIRKLFSQIVGFSLVACFVTFTSGCNTSVSGGVTVSQSSNGTTTVSGTVTVTWKPVAQDLTVSDLQTAESSGYTVITNVPSSNFTLNSQNPVQATLTATTDQGYTSSVTVTLQPVTSTTSPVASGYAVYTFAVPSSSELSSWVQSVVANSTSSTSVSASVATVFNSQGTSGTYTLYVQVNSSQTGLQTMGSAVYVVPSEGVGGTCHTATCPDQP
jgi:hypothetical protein